MTNAVKHWSKDNLHAGTLSGLNMTTVVHAKLNKREKDMQCATLMHTVNMCPLGGIGRHV